MTRLEGAIANTGMSNGVPHVKRRAPSLLLITFVGLCGVLVLLTLLGLAIGARPIPLEVVVNALVRPDLSLGEHVLVQTLRLPRTMLGLEIGIALGLAGAAMQGLTRNPLADPGILGISAGASLAVVAGFVFFGVSNVFVGAWYAFAGAAVASIIVYGVGSLGREGVTPVKLALAGAAVTAMLSSLTALLLLRNIDVVGYYTQDWLVGSVAGRSTQVAVQAFPFIVVGSVMALSSGRLLNALSLGEDVARSLGQRVGRARAFAALSVIVLAGAAVAAAGPIAFVGLMVPHIARSLAGPDYRWILPFSAVLGAILLVGADVAGRVIAPPGEVRVGTMTVVIGAPFFVMLIRRRKLTQI